MKKRQKWVTSDSRVKGISLISDVLFSFFLFFCLCGFSFHRVKSIQRWNNSQQRRHRRQKRSKEGAEVSGDDLPQRHGEIGCCGDELSQRQM